MDAFWLLLNGAQGWSKGIYIHDIESMYYTDLHFVSSRQHGMLFNMLIFTLLGLFSTPFVSASAAGQFKLEHTENASRESLFIYTAQLDSVRALTVDRMFPRLPYKSSQYRQPTRAT